MRVGGVELGGTKAIIVAGEGDRIDQRRQFPTTTPDETLANIASALRDFHAMAPLEAIGVASFGPIRLDPVAVDFGRILATPKPGWSNADIVRGVAFEDGMPVAIDTDVTAAMLAEYRYGAARDCTNAIYLTIGTGVGGGVVVDGRLVHGVLHPEIGHIRIRRSDGDTFAGTCPFHGDCIEGLISGPSLAGRFGCDPTSVDAEDARWHDPARDLAELLGVLILTYSPHRIVIGGGVALGQPQLLDHAKKIVPGLLANYLSDWTPAKIAAAVRLPLLVGNAGPIGAMALASNQRAAV